jgi:acetyl esterase/lipase
MLLDYDRIDPELVPALDQMPALDITRDNIVRIRELLASRPQPPSEYEVLCTPQTINADHGTVDVFVYRKTDRPDQPGVLWIHGGGYVLGNAEDERARMIAHTLDCTVVSVDYRLAPEHPFPAGPDDCYAALTWMAEQASDLGIDPDRIAMGGASAGGGMAAGVALMARDRGGPQLKLQLLLYPMIDNLHATQSGQIENHPVWKQETSFNAWEMYLDGTPGDDASMYAAASRAERLNGLAPAYICVGSEDLFRDEDLEYARRLSEAAVPCEVAVYPGLYHGADMFVPGARVSKRLNNGFLNALGDALT